MQFMLQTNFYNVVIRQRKAISCSDVALPSFDENIIIKRILKIKQQNKIIIGTLAAVNVRYKGQQYIIRALGS